ncbi:MAG: hypothetical protein IJ432_05310 [Clostridia bacterium]|nr:hypothetical protein [Clostridia bacterium]MEE1054992.1 hypothetical protein [Acutalibacteraceae bacterium]
MTFSFALKTLFELALVVAVFWGIFHEDRLIAFEKRIISTIRRRRLRLVKCTVKALENI